MAQTITSHREFVADLERKIDDVIRERVLEGPFIRDLTAGTLPLAVLQGWARNWYSFALEINSSISCLYHRFGSLFKQYPDWEDFITERIGEELSLPGPGGHIRTMVRFGEALGVSAEEMKTQPLIPECRGGIDSYVRIIFEGTIHEIAAVLLNEKSQGSTAFTAMYQALLGPPYSIAPEDLQYLSLHGEVDADHGRKNAEFMVQVLERIPLQERLGFGMEYCALTWANMFARVYDGVYQTYMPKR